MKPIISILYIVLYFSIEISLGNTSQNWSFLTSFFWAVGWFTIWDKFQNFLDWNFSKENTQIPCISEAPYLWEPVEHYFEK